MITPGGGWLMGGPIITPGGGGPIIDPCMFGGGPTIEPCIFSADYSIKIENKNINGKIKDL